MGASKPDIGRWLEGAKRENAKFMIVACDTFSYDDYPILCKDEKTCLEQYDAHDGKNMQKVMEVYDLSLSIEQQLNEFRAYYLPKRKE